MPIMSFTPHFPFISAFLGSQPLIKIRSIIHNHRLPRLFTVNLSLLLPLKQQSRYSQLMGRGHCCCCCCFFPATAGDSDGDNPARPTAGPSQDIPPIPPHDPPVMGVPLVVLPYAHVDGRLRALAGQAEGFGRNAVGGLNGAVYHVTSLADDGFGSLREACRINEPLWIVFNVSGTIHLLSYVRVSSYKTIDGRGQKIKLSGKGLQLREVEHIIICNLEFEGGRGHDVDAIQIKPKSRHIWIDRCSLRDFDDGLIDITRESTDITVSRCHFSKHDKTMLIGGDSSNVTDRCIRVTIHHCFFDGTVQRHPRVRFGKVHLYNNYTRNWGIYAVCASVEAQVVSQCNIYEAGAKKAVFKYLIEKAADKEQGSSGLIRSEGDLFLNGAQPCLQEGVCVQSVFQVHEYYPTGTLAPTSMALKEALQACTGWQAVAAPLDDCK